MNDSSTASASEKVTMNPEAMESLMRFPLLKALVGRRSRRFAAGAEIGDSPLQYKSEKAAEPLSEEETIVLLCLMAGNSGWHFGIPHNPSYAPHIANYAGAAGGRSFPSPAGFHISQLFFTNDEGIFYFDTRDLHPNERVDPEDPESLKRWLAYHQGRIKQVSEERLDLPREDPHIEGHNTWIANIEGSTLFVPVTDLAQHMIANLCYLVQNGAVFFDDLSGEKVEGVEAFGDLVAIDDPYPLSYVEHLTLSEASAELAMKCYSGVLGLQAMGLGGWMFNGMFRNSVLGAWEDPPVDGLGFRYDTSEKWTLPNPTGLEGFFEAYCPPRFDDVDAAVEAFCDRKFGEGGPFNPNTPGPWKESRRVRSSAQVHNETFRDCVKTMANHIYRIYGKIPATLPSVFCHTYMQAHHLDLSFYDEYFDDGAYLNSHRKHAEVWHGDGK